MAQFLKGKGSVALQGNAFSMKQGRVQMAVRATKFSQAINFLRTILDPDCHRFKKNLNLALSYESTGDRASAIKCYHECIRSNPGRHDLYKNIGMLYYETQDYNCAIKYLDKTFCDPEVGLYLGLCYLKSGRLDKSEQILNQISHNKSTYSRMLAEQICQYKNKGKNRGADTCNDHDAGNLGHLYSALELADCSTKEEIKKAYIKMVKEWHPDRFFNDPNLLSRAEQKMKVINEAYYKLCNC